MVDPAADRWLPPDVALATAAEVGATEADLLAALARGDVRSRGWSVPLEEDAARASVPADLPSHFWPGQPGVGECWEDPQVRDSEVDVEVNRPSLEAWTLDRLRQAARRHADAQLGAKGRTSSVPFLRELHAGRARAGVALPRDAGEIEVLLRLLALADPGEDLLGPRPVDRRNLLKEVFRAA